MPLCYLALQAPLAGYRLDVVFRVRIRALFAGPNVYGVADST